MADGGLFRADFHLVPRAGLTGPIPTINRLHDARPGRIVPIGIYANVIVQKCGRCP